MNYHKLMLVSTALMVVACKKTVTLKLNTVPAQIVIQGEITNQQGPYTVQISQTVGFYEDNTFPPVSGASVYISDITNGLTDSLIEVAPGTGIYGTFDMIGVPGHTYTLSVTSQQKNYTATSTMPFSVPLDSIGFSQLSGFGNKQIDAITNFQDPAGITNYYQFVEFVNGAQITKDIFVFDDRLSDGKYINYTLYNDTSYLFPGDEVKVNMYCIDENVYNYFYQLIESGGAGAFSTTASPANPTSNISNGALGYFSAHTVDSATAVVY
jgi:Domain of unknown function (DUF4249)